MKIYTGPAYADFETLVDTLDATLTLDAVVYYADAGNTHVLRAWAILNSGAGAPIYVLSGDYLDGDITVTDFTTDFASAVEVTTASIMFGE